jgi:hypothetical protein
MAKPVVITLNVQANTLFGITSPTQAQVDGCCSISDNNGGTSSNGTIENYSTPVFINFNVMWNGATADQGYSVAITSIVYEADSDDVISLTMQPLPAPGGVQEM